MVEAGTCGTASNPSKHPLTSFSRMLLLCVYSIPIFQLLKDQGLHPHKDGGKDFLKKEQRIFFTAISIGGEIKGRV